MEKAKILYDEWKSLKRESINYQRAGADGYMTEGQMKRDTEIFNRIKEIEPELFPLLQDREVLTYDKVPVEKAERDQDKFYIANYLIDWIKVHDSLVAKDGLVSGQIIYAKIPE